MTVEKVIVLTMEELSAAVQWWLKEGCPDDEDAPATVDILEENGKPARVRFVVREDSK